MENELVVACAVWGDWPGSRVGHNIGHSTRGGDASMQPEYIRRLKNGVERNLTIPHRFICFADDPLKVPPGIEYMPLNVPWICRGLPKAYVYGAPDTGCPIQPGTRILMFDLDNVIIGNIDAMAQTDHELIVRERGYMLPQWVPDGDMIFSIAGSGPANICAEIYHQEMESRGASTDHGDERIVLDRAGAKMWGQVLPGYVASFKRGCNYGDPPEGTRVVSFHGKPLPDQVENEWVKEHWR